MPTYILHSQRTHSQYAQIPKPKSRRPKFSAPRSRSVRRSKVARSTVAQSPVLQRFAIVASEFSAEFSRGDQRYPRGSFLSISLTIPQEYREAVSLMSGFRWHRENVFARNRARARSINGGLLRIHGDRNERTRGSGHGGMQRGVQGVDSAGVDQRNRERSRVICAVRVQRASEGCRGRVRRDQVRSDRGTATTDRERESASD